MGFLRVRSLDIKIMIISRYLPPLQQQLQPIFAFPFVPLPHVSVRAHELGLTRKPEEIISSKSGETDDIDMPQ